MVRKRKPRRGVVLLLVISLLALFVLIAVTYAVVSTQYRSAAVAALRTNQIGDQPRRELDQVMYMLLRDTNDRTSLQSHSLLNDLYGVSDRRAGTIVAATPVAGGQLLELTCNPSSASEPFDTLAGYYNGAVLTMLTGVAKGQSTRIVGYSPGPPHTIRVEAWDSDATPVASSPPTPLPSANDVFLVNGRAFNGTGIGYDPATRNLDHLDSNMAPHVLLPHVAGYSTPVRLYGQPYAATVPPSPVVQLFGDADESWDAPDYSNMFLASIPPSPDDANPIIPSFHRPDLINYMAVNHATAWADPNFRRKFIFRPMPWDHPRFTGSNPFFDALVQAPPTRSIDTNILSFDGPWDVDNDGDGTPDSIWIDPGLPVLTARDGRRVKRLVAIQVRDMDGRLNVNAHGSLAQISNALGSPPAPPPPPPPPFPPPSPNYSATSWIAGSPPSNVKLPRGLGMGTADIFLGHLFPAPTTPPSPPFDEHQNIVQSRYGNDQVPGKAETTAAGYGANDRLSFLKLQGLPDDYATSPQAFGSRPDLSGRGVFALGHAGHPLTANMGDAGETTDHPYQFDPVRGSSADAPYTVAELERVLRSLDVDANALPGRLQQLAPTAFGANATTRNLITTLSSHIPTSPQQIPSSLRNQVAAATTVTSSTQSGSMSVLDLYRARLSVGNAAATELEIQKIVPWEILHGQAFDVNRWFGNGRDDGPINGSVDEPQEVGAGEIIWSDSTPPGALPSRFQSVSFNYNNDVTGIAGVTGAALPSPPAAAQPPGPNPRHLFARHLYCLALLVCDDGQPGVVNLPLATRRRLAQWAVNVVDFRDRDAIMTPFEYDTNPFNGWNVDGDPRSTNGEGEREVVWGFEYPDLLLTETLAMHDRRVKDTSHDRNGTSRKRFDMPNGDPHLDQYGIPEGSLFLELYCARNGGGPSPAATFTPRMTPNSAFPAELYTGNGRLDLGRLAPSRQFSNGMGPGPDLQHPVWRVALVQNPLRSQSPQQGFINYVTNTYAGEISPLGMSQAIERIVWFSPHDPVDTPEERMVFFGRTGTALPHRRTTTQTQSVVLLEPGKYLVAGPRPATYIGSRIAGGSATPPNVPAQLQIQGAPPGPGSAVPFSYFGGPAFPGNIQSPLGIVCAARPPAAWTNQNWLVGMNISEPLPQQVGGQYYPEPTYGSYYADLAQAPNNGMMMPNFTYDSPFDEDAAYGGPLQMEARGVRSGTREEFQLALLQRLANPLSPWNPDENDPQFGGNYDPSLPLNPYITVDWSTVDLTVFSGEEDSTFQDPTTNAWIDPSDQNPMNNMLQMRFGTRERGANNAGNASYLWSAETKTPTVGPAAINPTAFINWQLPHSLGYLNTTFGAPQSPANSGYTGVPTTPFPWLTWNDRPFANPMEVMLVTASSSSRLGVEFSVLPTGADPYVAAAAPHYYGHLLNFFESPAGAGMPAEPQFGRLLDYIETPSLFAGAERWYDPATCTNDPNFSFFRPPYNRLSRFRDPGRMNVNTIVDQREFEGLVKAFADGATNDTRWNLSTMWAQFQRSRRGHTSPPPMPPPNPHPYPTNFANPFRSAAAADLMPNVRDMRKTDSVQATLLRSDPSSNSTPLFGFASTELHQQADHNPFFRLQGLTRLSNLTTTHSNVFAVWLTIGYFEAEGVPVDAAHPDGMALGQEVGWERGEVVRHRAFYLIDRSIPVAFEVGQNHNVDRAVLLRRFIE